jgi:hypothetical protein
MHSHGPSCLEGPFSRKRICWRAGASSDGASARPGPESVNPGETKATRENRPIRWDLVERVRREIEAGAYDTPEKMEIAMARLFSQLENE